MANWNGSGDQHQSSFGNKMPPPSPDMVQVHRQLSPQAQFARDSEDNVSDQTEDVFRNFLYQSYRQEQSQQDFDETPAIPELVTFTADPLSSAARVGRQLAKIGDDINNQYADEFNGMIRQLNITEHTVYETFEGVARKLFEQGINWGRVATLLCFGYRIAMKVLRVKDRIQQFGKFLKTIINFIVRFIKKNIAKWIADQGGWVSALSYNPYSWTSVGMILGSAFLTVAAVYIFSRRGS
ncbi:hypothetical protein ScPMuIL_012214 [Solemya velum]